MNTELALPNDPVEASILLVRKIDGAVDLLRPLVYEVWEKELWKGRFSSFGEYVESPDGLGKSQGYASKLKGNEQFRIESGLSPEQINGIDHEALWLARKGGGTPEEIVSKARTLTRAELKQEKNEAQPHTPNFVEMCTECYVSRANHN